MRQLIAAALLSVVAAGCSGLPEVDGPFFGSRGASEIPTGWVYTAGDEALHLQWAEAAGELRGSWQSAQLVETDVQVDSVLLSGTIDNRVIVLDLESLFGGRTLTGTVDGEQLTPVSYTHLTLPTIYSV